MKKRKNFVAQTHNRYIRKVKQLQGTSLFIPFVQNRLFNPKKGNLAALYSRSPVHLRAYPHEDYSQEK
jgi:hypothetical protein